MNAQLLQYECNDINMTTVIFKHFGVSIFMESFALGLLCIKVTRGLKDQFGTIQRSPFLQTRNWSGTWADSLLSN